MILANLDDVNTVLLDAIKSIEAITVAREAAQAIYYKKHRRKKDSRHWTTLWLFKRKEDETEYEFRKRMRHYKPGPYNTILLTPWGKLRFKYEDERNLLIRLTRALDNIISFPKSDKSPTITLTTDQVSAIYQLYT